MNYIAKAIGFSLLATLILGGIVWLLSFLHRTLHRILTDRISSTERKIEQLTELDISKTRVIAQRCTLIVVTVLIVISSLTWLAYCAETVSVYPSLG